MPELLVRSFTAILFAIAIARPVHADTFTWQGDRNNNYGNERNWSQDPGSGDVPDTTDDVIFPANADGFRLDLGGETRTVKSVFFQSDGSTGGGGYHWEFLDGTFLVNADLGDDVQWATTAQNGIVTVAGAMDFSGNSDFTGGTGGAFTLAIIDPISGTGPIALSGKDANGDDDALRLDARNNTFNGNVNVSDATLILNHLDALPNSVVDIRSGGQLEFIDGAVVALDSTDETIVIPSGKTLKVKASGETFKEIDGGGVFNLTQGGTTFEGGANFSGQLDFDNNATLKGSFPQARVDIASGQGLRVASDLTIGRLTGGGYVRIDDNRTFSIGGGNVITNNFGGRLARQGSGGNNKVILTAASAEYFYQYDGSLVDAFAGEVESRGNLTIGNNTFQIVTLNMIGNATLKVPNSGSTEVGALNTESGFELRSDLTIGSLNEDMSLSGTLSGDSALTKVGSGSLTLSGDITSSGKVTISAGSFEVDQPSTIAGDLDIDSSIEMNVETNSAPRIDVGGELNLAGSTLDLIVSGDQTAEVIELFSFGSLVGTFPRINGIPNGYTLDYGHGGQNVIALVDTIGPDVIRVRSVSDTELPTFDVTFNETISGFDASDLITNTTGFTGSPSFEITGSGFQYRVVVRGLVGSGEVSLGFSQNASFIDNYNNAFAGQGSSVIRIESILTNHYGNHVYREDVDFPEADFLIVTGGSYDNNQDYSTAPTCTIGGQSMQRVVYHNHNSGPSAIFILQNPPSGVQLFDLRFHNNSGNNFGTYAIYAVNGLDTDSPVVQSGSALAISSINFDPVLAGSLTLQVGIEHNKNYNLSVNSQGNYSGLTRTTAGAVAVHHRIEQEVTEAIELTSNARHSAVVFRAASVRSFSNAAPIATLSLAPGTRSPTNASSVVYNVAFSEPVTGLTVDDFSVSFGSNTQPTKTLMGAGSSYTLTLTNIAGDGFLNVSLPAGAAADAGGAPTTSPSPAPLVLVDQTAAVMLTNIPRTTLTNADTVTFDITFNKSVTGFGGASLIKVGSVSSSPLVLAGSGSNYTVTAPGLSGDGSFALQFSSNAITDIAGNIVTEFIISNPVTLDNTKPEIQLAGSSEISLLPGESWSDPGATISDSNPSAQGLVTSGNVVNPSVPGNYTITYNTTDGAGNAADQVTRLVTVQTQYEAWAAARGLGSSNNSLSVDANGDGKTNLYHFAFDTDPLGDGSSEGKIVSAFLPDGGSDEYFTLTLPMRRGLTFSGDPLTAEADGLRYILHADDDLKGAGISVIPRITQTDVSSLPSLSGFDGVLGPDYEYFSFRITDSIENTESAFLWVEVRLPD